MALQDGMFKDQIIKQGHTFKIEVEIVQELEDPKDPSKTIEVIPDLSYYKVWYVMYPYGQEDYEIFKRQLALNNGSANVYTLSITTVDSKDWQGAYTCEVNLEDINGNMYKYASDVLKVLKSGMTVGDNS